MSGGLGMLEWMILLAVAVVFFVGVPLVIYLLVRKAAADGAADAARRKDRS